jgi:hypothetical protein
MAAETADANRAAAGLLDLQPADQVLEVGFGHGATIALMAAEISGGRVAGVNISGESSNLEDVLCSPGVTTRRRFAPSPMRSTGSMTWKASAGCSGWAASATPESWSAHTAALCSTSPSFRQSRLA